MWLLRIFRASARKREPKKNGGFRVPIVDFLDKMEPNPGRHQAPETDILSSSATATGGLGLGRGWVS